MVDAPTRGSEPVTDRDTGVPDPPDGAPEPLIEEEAALGLDPCPPAGEAEEDGVDGEVGGEEVA